jgi:hypothetical protein
MSIGMLVSWAVSVERGGHPQPPWDERPEPQPGATWGDVMRSLRKVSRSVKPVPRKGKDGDEQARPDEKPAPEA